MKRTKIIVDMLMVIFLILSFVRWEDSSFMFHAIVGTACTLLFIIHIIIHRKWISSVTKSFLKGKLNRSTRGRYAINMLLLVVWGVAIITGFLAVGYFAADIEGMVGFSRLHAFTSRVGLGLIVIHTIQHLSHIKLYLGIRNKPKAGELV
ncbi:MAG: hypothetical protein FWC69_03320 [Defluviitaleaceae bacterium]|nr:hypothetical protein [Defluviitaleaceae bacterium]